MPGQEQQTLRIQAALIKQINLACQQSGIAILRQVTLENLNSHLDLADLTLSLETTPCFLEPRTWTISQLDAGERCDIDDCAVSLKAEVLAGLSQASSARLTLKVTHNNLLLAEWSKPVALLAPNQWGGVTSLPELLVSFSLPTDPLIGAVLDYAKEILRQANVAEHMDAYQSRSRERVWLITSACYAAIASLQLQSADSPVGFIQHGQTILWPGQVATGHQATELDAALLLAATLEQAGLYPLLVLTQHRVLVGVWLQADGFNTVVIDEGEILRQRIPLMELIVIDVMAVTASPQLPFADAVSLGEQAVALSHDPEFVCAIDVRRARQLGIEPLVLAPQSNDSAPSVSFPAVDIPQLAEAPAFPAVFDHIAGAEENLTAGGRLDRWQRKLLDLSARNPLLNFKPRKTSLAFVGVVPTALEDVLSTGVKLSMVSLTEQPSLLGEPRDIADLARTGLSKKQLLVDLPKQELDKRAINIYRKARRSLKESGSNTLYIALGFLLWKPEDRSDRRYRAPLVLLPVELERKTVRSGVRLIASDEEPSINTTLLELLKQDFGLEVGSLQGELPRDERGLDIEAIWHQVRVLIKNMSGFEVVEDSVLGHFSFAKYLMWRDLVDRSEALKQSRLVRHLLDNSKSSFDNVIPFVDAEDLDQLYTPADFFTPLSADSSQMSAIASADRGKDFILIGPPGTGKSQTISNLIAHMLGKGMKVLFVSEKTAALEVVYRRLKDMGLGQFCLQLHSNKTRKIDVLNQLRASWNSVSETDVHDWGGEAMRLKSLRDQLNALVDSLHRHRHNGMSVHYAMGVAIRDAKLASLISLSWPSANQHDEVQWQRLRNSVEQLSIQARALKEIRDHPLRMVRQFEWEPQWQREVVSQCQQLQRSALQLDQALTTLVSATGIDLGAVNLSKLPWVAELAQVLLSSANTPLSFAFAKDGGQRLSDLEHAIEQLQVYQQAEARLECQYEPQAWQALDVNALEFQWRKANQAWWPKRFFAKRSVLKKLRDYAVKGTPQADTDIPVLQAMQVSGTQLLRLDERLQGVSGWQSFQTEVPAITAAASGGQRGRAVLAKLAGDSDSLRDLYEQVRFLLNGAAELLDVESSVGRALTHFLAQYQEFIQQRQILETLIANSIETELDTQRPVAEVINSFCQKLIEYQASLKDWCGWMRRRSEALDLQLHPLVEALEQGEIFAEELVAIFEASYCAWWSAAVIGEDEVLRTFSSPEHNAVIDQFRQLDTDFSQLTADYIAAKLTSDMPDPKDINRKTSWGVLQHELQKKARHKPVRMLMAEIPEVITTLAPCLMMSPLSIAQYLPPEQTLFDLVIFDEASQITVWDAVGALARGHQVVMAGDPKQMPPTNFFARSEEDPDGEMEDEADLESILDELIGASVPQRLLNLHYRSRRESLIAFSNNRYYDRSLTTFPAPVYPDRGVSLVRPNGFYARGKARHNQGEAQAIVAEIVRRLMSQEEAVRCRSLGVVTFNAEQQELIEDLLDQARAEEPSIEWAFSEESCQEPVFVKNLETVQGDERDVIFFSITYGPDESGRLSMNFGPLNRLGGERRLNVALTRARFEMVVFSTLTPEQMDLTRTQARAVIDLKHFLEFAQRGAVVPGGRSPYSTAEVLSPFEQSVARALKTKGWIIHPGVGVSAYRVDLGVVHPQYPDRYLAGIECDGTMYASVAYARERDKIRQSVMQGLGWTLYRAWSIDWWVNPSKAVEDLHHALTQQLQAGSKS